MNRSLNEILSLPFISQVKMKERTKRPHDTVHLPLAASGTGLATLSLTPWKSHHRHQGASASGDSEQGKDDASLCCDLLFASRSWLCACSCLTKQISGSDLWPAASVLMRTSGISHSIRTSSPPAREGQIVSTLHWPALGTSQSSAFSTSGAVEGTECECERQNSYSVVLSRKRLLKINIRDFLPFLFSLDFFFSCSLSLAKREYYSKTISKQ